MRNFLQNLLIFFALCLCGLMAYQWVVQTDLNKQVQSLTDTIHDKSENIQNLQTTIHHHEDEIKRLDNLKNELSALVETNQAQIASLTKELDTVKTENDRHIAEAESFKQGLQTANENVRAANAIINKQQEDMTNVLAKQTVVVSNYNKLVKDFNDLAEKWNKQQEDLAKNTKTNSPAKK